MRKIKIEDYWTDIRLKEVSVLGWELYTKTEDYFKTGGRKYSDVLCCYAAGAQVAERVKALRRHRRVYKSRFRFRDCN